MNDRHKKFQYKRNGAGDVFRKQKNNIETFYRGKWIPASIIGTKKANLEIWNMPVLVKISENEALSIVEYNRKW